MWLKLYERAICSGQMYSFNYISRFLLRMHMYISKLVKPTDLVRNILWIEIFVPETVVHHYYAETPWQRNTSKGRGRC